MENLVLDRLLNLYLIILYSHHLSAILGFRGSDHAICKIYTTYLSYYI